MFSWFFKINKEKKEAQLSKDASLIINQARDIFGLKDLSKISAMVLEHLQRIDAQFGEEKIDLKRALIDCKRLHKNARYQNDQKLLSVMTLIIIYLHAKISSGSKNIVCRKILNFIDSPSIKK